MPVLKKLQEARITLQSTKLKKSGHNSYAGYDYFELADFLPSAQMIFQQLGLCGVVSFTQDIATLTVVDTEDDSRWVFTSPMAEAQLKGCHPVQNLGAAHTYLRRYLWVLAFEMVEHDALDATTGSGSGTPQNKESPDDVYKKLNSAASKGSKSLSAEIKKTPKESLDALSADQKKSLRAAAGMIDAELAGQA